MSWNYALVHILAGHSPESMIPDEWREGPLHHGYLLALSIAARREIRHARNVIITWIVITAIVMTMFSLIVKHF